MKKMNRTTVLVIYLVSALLCFVIFWPLFVWFVNFLYEAHQ